MTDREKVVSSLQKIAMLLWMVGFFTVTWDKIFFWDVAGMTFKLHQLAFGLSFGLLLATLPTARLKEFLSQPFTKWILLIIIYYLLMLPLSHFPKKSFLYSIWILFNLMTVAGSLFLLSRVFNKKILFQLVLATTTILAAVVVIDSLAFNKGYRFGFIGFNQEADLGWGLSRPSAFSSEPSYIASFLSIAICFCAGYLSQFFRRGKLHAFFASLLLVLPVMAILLTTSRTGIFALVLGAAVFVVFYVLKLGSISPKAWLGALVILFSSVALIGVLVPSQQLSLFKKSLVTPMMRGDDPSGVGRLEALVMSAQIAQKSYGLGVGLGASFKYRFTHINERIDYREMGQDQPDFMGREMIMSIWGQLLAEGGIPALLFYLLAMFYLLRRLWSYLIDKEEASVEALGVLVSLVAFFFIAFWIGNVARGDVWVWLGLWLFFARFAWPIQSKSIA